MTEANITIQELEPHLKVAHISGQLDESNIDEKIQVIYKAIEKDPIHLGLIFDLSELTYMNSKSIGYMTDIYGKIADNNGKVVIANAKPNIADILEVVGLTQLITIYESQELAKLKIKESLQNSGAKSITQTTTQTTASVATVQTHAAPAQTPTTPAQETIQPTIQSETPIASQTETPIAPAPVIQPIIQPTAPVVTVPNTVAPAQTPTTPAQGTIQPTTPIAPTQQTGFSDEPLNGSIQS